MLTLIAVFMLLFTVLAVLISVASRWGQGYFYETIVEKLAWRSMAVAGAITVFFGLWSFLEVKAPGRFDSLFNFGIRESKEFDHFWSERQGPSGPIETLFRRKTLPTGRVEYFDDAGKPWKRSDSGIVTAIIVEEDGERRRFAVQLAPDGKFQRDPRNPNQVADVRYIEESGKRRVMTESAMGQLNTTRYGSLFLNLLFNLALFLLWFACLWFVLEFQWGHAFLLGFIFWLASVTLVWPAVQGNLSQLSLGR